MNPTRGEIWMVTFDPQVGAEIRKKRPAVVLNLPIDQVLPLRLVVPFTEWQVSFAGRITKVPVAPSRRNGLSKMSTADLFQIRIVSTTRFGHKLGELDTSTLISIAEFVAVFVGAK